MSTAPATSALRRQRRCSRCGGSLIKDIDALACLMCGRRDYGPGYTPVGLDPRDGAAYALSRLLAADGPEDLDITS